MRDLFKRFTAGALLVAVAGLSLSARADPASAVTYLKSQPQDEWVTMALVAAGQTDVPAAPLQHFSGTLATDYAKRILAILAVGENPRTFTGVDLVSGLQGLARGGQLGDPNLLNDDAWGIMALVAAGVAVSDAAVAGAKAYLLQHQGSDGGWGYSLSAGSDSNDTAAVLMALADVGVASGSAVEAALAYLHGVQNNDGGFGYLPGATSDSGSTAWVWSALLKLGQSATSWSPGTGTPASFLASLELSDGSYKWQPADTTGSVVMTAFAVVALTGKYYPVLPISASASEPTVSYRLEGSSTTVCQGQVAAATALQVVERVASTCGYTYHVQQTSFGPYLDQINADQAQGSTGWLYLVNWRQPQVGAADFTLQAGDQVLWFFGEFTWQPLRLTVAKPVAQAGETVTVKAESFVESRDSWQPQAGATVRDLAQPVTTDSTGQASVSLPTTSLSLWAEAAGTVRSARVPIAVAAASQTITLDVTITQPAPLPPSASFVVSATSLSWGSLEPGLRTAQRVTITNTSSTPLHLEAAVSGDDVFTSYLALASQPWDSWQASLAASSSLPVDVALAVPSSFANFGRKVGTLVFWAAANQ